MCGGSKGCKRVPNPCKICLQTVNPKTGLQCQGACESWVHYNCLNYTPGKIRDIQKGEITVTCPCPDCKTSVPKEIRTDEPFSCNNVKCPANKAPACEAAGCQANEITNSRPPPYHPGQLLNCGTDCRNFMIPSGFASSPTDPCMEGFVVYGKGSGPKPNLNNMAGGGQNMMPTMSTVEQLSNTVGELTNQINDLMTKMKQAGGGGGAAPGIGAQPCTQKGPKSNCPKPCYCPGNPRTN